MKIYVENVFEILQFYEPNKHIENEKKNLLNTTLKIVLGLLRNKKLF